MSREVLRGEVGARAWRICGQTRGEVRASAGGARRLGEYAGESAWRVCPDKPSQEMPLGGE
jgi:hypothetical protein